jgi:hypothetical protein
MKNLVSVCLRPLLKHRPRSGEKPRHVSHEQHAHQQDHWNCVGCVSAHDACRAGFLSQPSRLLSGELRCSIRVCESQCPEYLLAVRQLCCLLAPFTSVCGQSEARTIGQIPNSNKVILSAKPRCRQSQLGILSESICRLLARAKRFKLEIQEINLTTPLI